MIKPWFLPVGLNKSLSYQGSPGRRKWLHTPLFLPGEFHGQRSMVGYSPWGHKELDMTEQLTPNKSKKKALLEW